MKKPFVALLLLVGAAAMVATSVFAQEAGMSDPGNKLVNAKMNRELMNSRAQRLRVSAGPDPDTVWFGYSHTDHWNATNNFWNLYTGVNFPTTTLNPQNAIWDWDNLAILASHGVGDSLAGWWPTRRNYNITGGLTLPDASRPWWAIDLGNQANYVINQGLGGKRTFGVVGVWHGDGGVGQAGGSAVQWTPLSGSRSAWCGLRQLNDNSVMDQVTKNPYNQSTINFMGVGAFLTPSVKRFPGYAGQWDQMLYRDIAAAPATALNISFLYKTRMSTAVTTTAATRTGWFHGDPLAVVAGNFISSTDAGANAPADSFQVYVGAPVIEASCLYSDGNVRAVYDPQRRWFSEVLRIFDAPYYRIFATAGAQPADTAAAALTQSISIPGTLVDNIRNAAGNTGGIVRLVFRVKTNRDFGDDDGGFNSIGRGAAIVDDVVVNGNNIGDFELAEQGGANSIDNRIGQSPLTYWKSTGKPPSIYYHLENVSNGAVVYNDLCGAWDSPARFCNISGNTLVAGNHDDFERHGDSRYTSDREILTGAWSPTINLIVDEINNTPNAQGVTASIKDVTDDYYVWYDIYAGMFNLQFSGNAWQFGAQGYPCLQPNNGASVWGDPIFYSFQIFNPEPGCFWDIEPLYGSQVLAVNTTSGLPDSLRFFLGTNGQCFRFAVSLGCNSADGAYFDNVSLGFADLPPATQVSSANAINPTTVTSDIWEFINDAFPANETPTLPNSANFDTTTALIKGGVNTAPSTGNALRFDVCADSILFRAPNVTGSTDPTFANQTRSDMVFRILPGPGNYAIASPGGRTFPPTASMQLLRVPTNQANIVSSGDGSFWGTYMADPGKFSQGTHHGGAYWDYLTWNSARCDTSEQNRFPVAGKFGSVITATGGNMANIMHDDEPKLATLGITKFRCFLVDTTQAAANTNVVCDGTVPAYLSVVPASRTGYNGVSTTKEYTKIIPDGLLTPGAHVQYFFRKSAVADSSVYVMDPDTNQVYQTVAEGSTDGHRWQQFGVLPDRWKDNAFGGSGMACMLYVDLNDRRGNERVFVSVMDSLGGTSAAKRGSHNGWSAPNIYGALGADLALYPVHGKNQQPGTTWDMYGVKASESLTTSAGALGNRLANRSSLGLLAGKEAKTGPTPEMLRKFYSILAILSGDLNSGILGPFANRSQNDIALLNDYLTGNDVGSTPQPRGILASGDGFAQAETWSGGVDPSHIAFLTTKLGVTLRNASYQSVSGNTNDCADLITTAVITASPDIYGVGNSCAYSNDLLQRVPAVPEAVDATFYEAVGVNAPYVASIYKPANGTRNWVAMTQGTEIEHEWSRYCESAGGRLAYYFNMYTNVFGSICSVVSQSPPQTLDVPQAGHGGQFANFMKVGNSVMRAGNARIHFGLANSDRVRIRMYDVTGRLVRTLADRSFNAGEYDLAWDGADDSGNQVARGVYFARIEYATKGAAINGRVVVLR
jgi:hypothetical protein